MVDTTLEEDRNKEKQHKHITKETTRRKSIVRKGLLVCTARITVTYQFVLEVPVHR